MAESETAPVPAEGGQPAAAGAAIPSKTTQPAIDLKGVQPDTQGPDPGDVGSPSAVQGGFKLEQTRAVIAYALLGMLAAVIILQTISASVLGNACWNWQSYCNGARTSLGMIDNALSPIFTAMVGLVGSVVGFYFGSKSQASNGG